MTCFPPRAAVKRSPNASASRHHRLTAPRSGTWTSNRPSLSCGAASTLSVRSKWVGRRSLPLAWLPPQIALPRHCGRRQSSDPKPKPQVLASQPRVPKWTNCVPRCVLSCYCRWRTMAWPCLLG